MAGVCGKIYIKDPNFNVKEELMGRRMEVYEKHPSSAGVVFFGFVPAAIAVFVSLCWGLYYFL